MLRREVQWEQQLVMTATANRWEVSTVSSYLNSFAMNMTKCNVAVLPLKFLLLLSHRLNWICLDNFHPRCVVPKKIHTPPMEVFLFEPPTHPFWNSSTSLASYFPLKTLAFESPPLQLNSQWPSLGMGGYGCFLEHTIQTVISKWFQSLSSHYEHN